MPRRGPTATTRGVPEAMLRDAGARLATMRRWVTPSKPSSSGSEWRSRALPGFDRADEPYFNRLGEQVNHLLASIDAAANAMGMLLDLQLNERAYAVSVLATIFVPLTFITGFFGMNFGGWSIRSTARSPSGCSASSCLSRRAYWAWLLVVRQLTGRDRKITKNDDD